MLRTAAMRSSAMRLAAATLAGRELGQEARVLHALVDRFPLTTRPEARRHVEVEAEGAGEEQVEADAGAGAERPRRGAGRLVDVVLAEDRVGTEVRNGHAALVELVDQARVEREDRVPRVGAL